MNFARELEYILDNKIEILELDYPVTEIYKSGDGFNSILDTMEERIHELERKETFLNLWLEWIKFSKMSMHFKSRRDP
jgi:hypothetical protein